MTDKWMPEVGQECEFFIDDLNRWMDAKVIGYDGPACVVAIDGFGYEGSSVAKYFRPITTEADKYRDKQIEKLASAISANDSNAEAWKVYLDDASYLYKKGCRILAPDERIVKPLTDEQIDKLVTKGLNGGYGYAVGYVITAVQCELGVID